MQNKHRKLAVIVSILFILGLITFDLVNSFKAESKNQRLVSESLNDIQKDKSVKEVYLNNVKYNNTIKEREFKGENLKYNDKSVPVLMYHSIDYEKGNELRVPKGAFREQMSYLKQNGYTTLTLDELYDFFINNKPVPNKSIVITFDDGYKDNFENAYPVLKEFGFNATIFIITSTVDANKNYLTSPQIKELEENGIDIESHTVKHEQLDKLTYAEQLTTLKNSREYIEKLLGKQKKYTAYPFGKWNDDTIKAVKEAGYSMVFTTESGWGNKSQGIYELHRVYVSANCNLKEFERRITDASYNKSN
ncbi:polysaccharide deacetylase family protein [Clostridium magnum]|uniref:Poly-beta-1,6-N-acetyl-D-glucosamine N-deacetylase n=1 Tax=Clostridium magnum DSM 2767 TaxID=1121326 RepID=A0A162RJB1_9CLOT|nr:polysaccharide deacetylase family protein [Clostridium magnum]KZL89993.1 poly-beta-1,6-N-acetyl-D-glucosamine N-deacetylase precursor [Clostridium magnum DSM 2767]SHI86648.1 Polysaccharide deacetylase [Clostridium magnum DSM 2767]